MMVLKHMPSTYTLFSNIVCCSILSLVSKNIEHMVPIINGFGARVNFIQLFVNGIPMTMLWSASKNGYICQTICHRYQVLYIFGN